MAQRDSKTGRFLPKSKQEPTPAQLESNKKYLMTLQNKLAIYMNKTMEGKPNNILPGAKVEIVKLGESNMLRVKRENCKRTYYTTQEQLADAPAV
jgi:hypothetical protein